MADFLRFLLQQLGSYFPDRLFPLSLSSPLSSPPYFWKEWWANGSLCYSHCQMKNQIFTIHSFFPTGWLKLQHPRWYRSVLRSHQSVRELRKHDNHLFHQSLLIWKASSRKSRGGCCDGIHAFIYFLPFLSTDLYGVVRSLVGLLYSDVAFGD